MDYSLIAVITSVVTQAQSVYKDGGKVKPLTTTIKVYRRTA